MKFKNIDYTTEYHNTICLDLQYNCELNKDDVRLVKEIEMLISLTNIEEINLEINSINSMYNADIIKIIFNDEIESKLNELKNKNLKDFYLKDLFDHDINYNDLNGEFSINRSEHILTYNGKNPFPQKFMNIDLIEDIYLKIIEYYSYVCFRDNFYKLPQVFSNLIKSDNLISIFDKNYFLFFDKNCDINIIKEKSIEFIQRNINC